MPTQTVFENEEAAQLLDYFIAYRKLISTANHIKHLASMNTDINLKQINPAPTKGAPINPINENQTTNLNSTPNDILISKL